jgi:hypothetical protein
VSTRDRKLLEELRKQGRGLENHLKKASKFLINCQIAAPYVTKGTLLGCVCPWEIGESADEGAFPIVEDFHDTLEAVWVWSLYTKVSGNMSFRSNVDRAWEYVIDNWGRFIGNEERTGKSLYDCSYVLFSGTLFASVFDEKKYWVQFLLAGNRLAEYLSTVESTDGREYSDPFWMAHCLGLAATKLRQKRWGTIAQTFVKHKAMDAAVPFTRVEEEPAHVGPGGHDFFSKNANVALALISCFGEESKKILLTKFLPCVSASFVVRHADENAWNAHLAAALGKSYVLTRRDEFLRYYLLIMNELAKRDHRASAALPRSPSFGRRESWVTFFYAHAYASATKSLTDWTCGTEHYKGVSNGGSQESTWSQR